MFVCMFACKCTERWLSIDSFLMLSKLFSLFSCFFVHTYFRPFALMMRKRAEKFRDEEYAGDIVKNGKRRKWYVECFECNSFLAP